MKICVNWIIRPQATLITTPNLDNNPISQNPSSKEGQKYAGVISFKGEGKSLVDTRNWQRHSTRHRCRENDHPPCARVCVRVRAATLYRLKF